MGLNELEPLNICLKLEIGLTMGQRKEGTETGGFAAGDGAKGGRLGRWRNCWGRMLEKTPKVVLQWSTQTLRQGTVICIFFF
jgi:hypothetical protein